MKKLGIILCAAMLVLVSACSGGNSNSGTTIGTDPQNLKVAMGGQITTLDPGLSTENRQQLHSSAYNGRIVSSG